MDACVVYKMINGKPFAKTYDKGTATRMVEQEGWSFSEEDARAKLIMEQEALPEETEIAEEAVKADLKPIPIETEEIKIPKKKPKAKPKTVRRKK